MKVWNYVVIATGLVLFLEFSGLPTGAQGLLSFVGLGTDSAAVGTSSLYSKIFDPTNGILIVGIAAGVVISFFTRSSPENYIILPLITGSLTLFVSSFYSIMNYSLGNYPSWVSGLIVLVFGPFTVGYLLALVEFFRGTD